MAKGRVTAVFIINGRYYKTMSVEKLDYIRLRVPHNNNSGNLEEVVFHGLEFFSQSITNGLKGRDRMIYVAEISDKIFVKIGLD